MGSPKNIFGTGNLLPSANTGELLGRGQRLVLRPGERRPASGRQGPDLRQRQLDLRVGPPDQRRLPWRRATSTPSTSHPLPGQNIAIEVYDPAYNATGSNADSSLRSGSDHHDHLHRLRPDRLTVRPADVDDAALHPDVRLRHQWPEQLGHAVHPDLTDGRPLLPPGADAAQRGQQLRLQRVRAPGPAGFGGLEQLHVRLQHHPRRPRLFGLLPPGPRRRGHVDLRQSDGQHGRLLPGRRSTPSTPARR